MVSFDWGSASKVDDVTALPSRHKMADMCFYGNVMTTTRWRLCVTILHLQQYSHRLNFHFFDMFRSSHLQGCVLLLCLSPVWHWTGTESREKLIRNWNWELNVIYVLERWMCEGVCGSGGIAILNLHLDIW